jgi:predicted transcriptional regulator
MKESNTKTKERIEWRRTKVNELVVKGFSQVEIARMLQISEPTISRDIEYLRESANETIRNHIQKKLPYEYTKCISGLEEIIKEGWQIAINADKKGDSKEKLQSLSLIKDTYNTKMDLLTNASLLQDSIKYVEESKQNLLSNKNENSNIDYSNDIQGSTEINNNEIRSSSQSEQQYNQVY